MQINQYTTYSILSFNENKNCIEQEEIFSLIENFAKFKTREQAKAFLRKTYQIKDSLQQFELGTNCYLDIVENPKKYSVRIFYTKNDEKECVIYNYKK